MTKIIEIKAKSQSFDLLNAFAILAVHKGLAATASINQVDTTYLVGVKNESVLTMLSVSENYCLIEALIKNLVHGDSCLVYSAKVDKTSEKCASLIAMSATPKKDINEILLNYLEVDRLLATILAEENTGGHGLNQIAFFKQWSSIKSSDGHLVFLGKQQDGDTSQRVTIILKEMPVGIPEAHFIFTEKQLQALPDGLFELLELTTKFIKWLSNYTPEMSFLSPCYWEDTPVGAVYEVHWDDGRHESSSLKKYIEHVDKYTMKFLG